MIKYTKDSDGIAIISFDNKNSSVNVIDGDLLTDFELHISNAIHPILIDQPEDNLDSEFIYQTLVPVLRRAKERRQVIIVTHNANIAVLGDAEQIIVLKSDAEHGRIISRGSIDNKETRDFACAILEGAEEAFRRRARIYGVA